MKTNRLGVWALALVMAGTAGVAMAQDQAGGQRQRGQRGQNNGGQPGQPGQPGQRGQRGNFDPAAMRERYMNGIKERLGATDDEWKVLQPKIEKVMAARDSRGGGFTGGRSGRDRGGSSNTNAAAGEQSAVAKASADLRAALEDKSMSAEEITKRLTAYREAREKSRADRAAAQKELKDVLSARQEAVLVSSGLLD
jgi:hypothetical protein